MPKRPLFAILVTGTALVLLLNFKTPDAAGTALTAGQAVVGSPAPSGQTASAATGPSATGSTTASSASGAATSGTFTGSTVQTRYGPVQVQITVQSGKITAVQALQYPSNDPHSSQISQYAIPTLVQATLQAQSAQVNTVSGATYTSQAFLQSLQAALTQANA